MRRILFLMFLILAAGYRAKAEDSSFESGLVALDAGNFTDAATDFDQAVKHNPSSGALLNLGIAEWQRGHAGAAILAWERAQWLDPLDSRAAQNLKFAHEAAQLEAPDLRWQETVSALLPSIYWVWISSAGLWLAGGALILPRVWRRSRSGVQQFLVALGICLFALGMVANYGGLSRTDIGVVLKKDAPLLLTPTSGAEVVTTLNAGESARVVKVRGKYYLIRTEFGLGWADRAHFGLINPR